MDGPFKQRQLHRRDKMNWQRVESKQLVDRVQESVKEEEDKQVASWV